VFKDKRGLENQLGKYMRGNMKNEKRETSPWGTRNNGDDGE
jgi:hypothetical protein